MHDSVLECVTLRRSLGAKYLTTPAPSKEDYAEALTWAIAAPDHCHLSPARFVVIEERQKFGRLFEAALWPTELIKKAPSAPAAKL